MGAGKGLAILVDFVQVVQIGLGCQHVRRARIVDVVLVRGAIRTPSSTR